MPLKKWPDKKRPMRFFGSALVSQSLKVWFSELSDNVMAKMPR
ncbi:hypothetical protein [Methylomonas fluvii]|nr:hypothetical protein [Methylomonas fluvii]